VPAKFSHEEGNKKESETLHSSGKAGLGEAQKLSNPEGIVRIVGD
jgi:hypothetical protein